MVALGKAKRNDEKFCNLYFMCLGDNDHRKVGGWIASPTNSLINGEFFF